MQAPSKHKSLILPQIIISTANKMAVFFYIAYYFLAYTIKANFTRYGFCC